MAIKAKPLPKGNGNFTPQAPLEPDTYMARIVRVIDLGVQPQKPWRGEEKPPIQMIQLTYEFPTEFMKDENGKDIEDKPRWKSEIIPLYPIDREKAKSTKRYEAIDPSHKYGGDFSQLVGKPCMVSIVQNVAADGRVWDNIAAVTKIMKGLPVPELQNEPVVFSLDEPDMTIYDSFPDWLKEKIESNLHFENSPLQKALGVAPKPKPEPEIGGHEDFDMDDVPF